MSQPDSPGSVIDWSVVPAGLESVAADLRALRVAAGQPSYAEIARRVMVRRAVKGVPEHERRVARSTVYDCFRAGRRRLDVDLIVEVAVALGLAPEYVPAWAERCRVARGAADAASVVVAHSEMPRPVAEFVGRRAELEAVAAGLAGGSTTVWIDGMAGAGKTQFALRVAQERREQPWGQEIFLDLRGHRSGAPPVEPDAAQDALLRRLGVQDHHTWNARRRTAALRDALARSGTLLVLDDARDEAQVVGVVGSDGPGVVLVTSRVRPAAATAGWFVLTLGSLDQDEASDLLRRVAGAAAVDADASSAARLIDALGGLPLALSLVASRIGSRPDWELAEHVDLVERRLAQSRLDGDLQATLALSFADLPDDAARLLRLIAQASLLTVDADAAAALADVSPGEAARTLSVLAHRSLVVPRGENRATLHALVRAYAHERSEEIDAPRVRDAAFARLARHWAERVWAAYAAVARRAGDEPRRTRFSFGDVDWEVDVAESWLTDNLDNLLSMAHAAPGRGHPEVLFQMSDGLSWWLNLVGRYREAIRLHDAAADAAAAIGDVEALATASFDAGQTYAQLGNTQEALEHLRRATRLIDRDRTFSELVDPGLVGLLFNMTSVMLVRRGDLAEAVDCLRRAIDIHEELGETNRLLSCLINLGVALHTLGRFAEEQEVVDRGVRIAESGDHRLMLATLLVNRSSLWIELGRTDDALGDAARALDLADELGLALVIAEAEGNASDAYRLRGELDLARDHASRAVDVARRTDDHRLVGEVLLVLARVQLAAGDDAGLGETLAEADETSGRSDDPLLRARVTRMRGDASSEPGTRLALWRQALRAFERLGVPDADELRQAMEALAAGDARSAAEEPADLR